ncbi:MAG TPA: YetF domain-containing protein [Vicinamibacterales bacterium]
MDASMLTNLFHIGPDAQTSISLIEKIVRPVLVYLFLVVGLRLAGKRELAQLNAFDLIVLLTLSNTVQNAIIGADNSVLGGVIGATTLLVFNYVVVRFVFAHPRVERLLEGDADVLMRGGSVIDGRLRTEGMTVSELEAAARRQGFSSLQEIDKAILEANGSVTFVAKKPRANEARHQDLMKRLDELSVEVKVIRTRLEGTAS